MTKGRGTSNEDRWSSSEWSNHIQIRSELGKFFQSDEQIHRIGRGKIDTHCGKQQTSIMNWTGGYTVIKNKMKRDTQHETASNMKRARTWSLVEKSKDENIRQVSLSSWEPCAVDRLNWDQNKKSVVQITIVHMCVDLIHKTRDCIHSFKLPYLKDQIDKLCNEQKQDQMKMHTHLHEWHSVTWPKIRHHHY